MTMIQVNIYEAKAKLAALLRMLKKGEKVVICNRNVPVAEPVPLHETPRKRRTIGLAKGKFEIPPAFFDPLPEEESKGWYGDWP